MSDKETRLTRAIDEKLAIARYLGANIDQFTKQRNKLLARVDELETERAALRYNLQQQGSVI